MPYLYCERVGPGLWGEPVNLVTNAAYLAAAWALYRHSPVPSAITRLLAALIAAVGFGSSAFHALTTASARRLDEAPILVFQIVVLWLYGRQVLRLSRSFTVAVAVGFVAAVGALRAMPPILNGSLPYVPAMFAVAAIAAHDYREGRADRLWPVAAAIVFPVAVWLRTIDQAVCPTIPIGTHGGWHVLTAFVMYGLARGVSVDALKT
jgi:hypothetical protein